MESSKPSYYAIIPACVRYDETLSPNAKLLFAEITALCNTEGYCWASNSYFAKLYSVEIRTVQRWLVDLKNHELIYMESDENNGNTLRKIFLVMTKMSSPHDKNVIPPHDKNVTQIIQDINIKNNIAADKKKTTYSTRTKKPTLAEVEAYVTEKGYNIDASLFFDYYDAADWHDKNGNLVKNWKLKLVTWSKHNSNTSPKPQAEQPNKTWCNPKATDEAELNRLRQESEAFLNNELEKNDGKQVHGFERYLRRGKPSVSDIRKE